MGWTGGENSSGCPKGSLNFNISVGDMRKSLEAGRGVLLVGLDRTEGPCVVYLFTRDALLATLGIDDAHKFRTGIVRAEIPGGLPARLHRFRYNLQTDPSTWLALLKSLHGLLDASTTASLAAIGSRKAVKC